MRTVSFDFDDADARFVVLANAEGQYSLWPADLATPGGWSPTEIAGDRPTCESRLDQTWTDLRPASLRDWTRSRAR